MPVCRLDLTRPLSDLPRVCWMTGQTEGVELVPWRARTSILPWQGQVADLRLPLGPTAKGRQRLYRMLRTLHDSFVVWGLLLVAGWLTVAPDHAQAALALKLRRLGLAPEIVALAVVPCLWLAGYLVWWLLRPAFEPVMLGVRRDEVAVRIRSAAAARALEAALGSEPPRPASRRWYVAGEPAGPALRGILLQRRLTALGCQEALAARGELPRLDLPTAVSVADGLLHVARDGAREEAEFAVAALDALRLHHGLGSGREAAIDEVRARGDLRVVAKPSA